MIVVEGMDNTGKTTLIEMLAKALNLYSVKVASRPKETSDVFQCLSLLANWDLQCKNRLIADRLQVISEYIYGPICRNTNIVGDEVFRGFLESLPGYKMTIIWCRPKNEIIKSSLGHRDQMAGVSEQADKLIARYDEVMWDIQIRIPLLQWDYTRGDFSSLLHAVTVQGGFNQ